MFATTYRKPVSAYALLLLTALVFGLAAMASPVATARPLSAVSLVNTIYTSRWSPASPDPSGITYWPARKALVVVDGEVEEMPNLFKGVNVWQTSLTGTVGATYSTLAFTKEPVGIDIAVNTQNNNFFISDDSKKTIHEIALGPDGKLGTSDDIRRSFLTSSFGNNDPEGLTLGAGKLYTVDGTARKLYISEPGANGRFDGAGDDRVTSFDLGVLGIGDPEGIDFNTDSGTLYIADRAGKAVFEVTTAGKLIRKIALKPIIASVLNPGDVTLAPSSRNAAVKSMYIVDRGVDNNVDPNENDGKIYELTLN